MTKQKHSHSRRRKATATPSPTSNPQGPSARHTKTQGAFGSRFQLKTAADILAHPALPPPPSAAMTRDQRRARVREIVIGVIAWLADLPDESIHDEDPLRNVTDAAAYQTLSSEIARGLQLTRGEEASLYTGLVNEKWDTVGDLVAAMVAVVEKHFS